MKYLSLMILLLLTIITAFNYSRLRVANGKIERYDKANRKIQNDAENYLFSLTNYSVGYCDSKILLMTGDTINLENIDNPCLFYFFSPNDCISCVEENIFTLIELAKEKKSGGIYIVTTKGKEKYLKMLSRVHTVNSLCFGCLLDTSSIYTSSYFLKLGTKEISNAYYPQKGKFESTQRYLKYVKEIICNPDYRNRMSPK